MFHMWLNPGLDEDIKNRFIYKSQYYKLFCYWVGDKGYGPKNLYVFFWFLRILPFMIQFKNVFGLEMSVWSVIGRSIHIRLQDSAIASIWGRLWSDSQLPFKRYIMFKFSKILFSLCIVLLTCHDALTSITNNPAVLVGDLKYFNFVTH